MAEVSNEAMATVAEKSPVTAERSVRSDLDTKLPKPYLPRAVVAPDTEDVNGTQGHQNNSMSALQQLAALSTKIMMVSSSRLRCSEVANVSKYAHTALDKLTFGELWNMTQANRNAFNFFDWIASKLEWGVLYLLARDRDGFLSKEAVRQCFDGSLFEYCAKGRQGAASKLG